MTGKSAPSSGRKRQKGKRWAKGQSSSCNPTYNRHRQLAKSSVLSYPSFSAGPYQGNLTENAIKVHDQDQASIAVDEDDIATVHSFKDDVLSGSFQVPAFDRFLSKFSIQSNMHKQMLSILTAVRDIIKGSDGRESETEYFATLMTTLESTLTADELAAAITLVNTIIRRVPTSILRKNFSGFSKMFDDLLTQNSKCAESDHNILIGQLTSCLGYLLQVQDRAEWNNKSTQNMFQDILHFVTHSQPKIRKSARRTVYLVVTADGNRQHPSAKVAADYCIPELNSYSGGKLTTNNILHIFNLLNEIIMYFPAKQLKETCRTILEKMNDLANIQIKICSLVTFHALFSGLPKAENMPPLLAVQITNALHSFSPSANDSNLMPKWLATMEAASIHLHTENSDLKDSWMNLQRVFKKGREGWLSKCPEIQKAVTSTFKALLYKILEPLNETPNVPVTTLQIIGSLFNTIEECMAFQYNSVWDQVIHVLAVFFETAGKFASKFMQKCLQNLASLRDSHHFAYSNNLDYAIGKAVRSMGPDVVLSAIPLTIRESDRINDGCCNNWLVPILRDNICHAKLSFFATYFLPLADSCLLIAQKLQSEGKLEAASNYELLHTQLWSCLPGFCNSPSDLAENFKTVAKTLGQSLNQQPQLRLDILAALRSVIKSNLDNETNKIELMRFSKNFLPILMNLYTTEPDAVAENHIRLAVLETIIVYLQITPPESCTKLFDKIVSKLEDGSADEFMKQAILDVSRTLIIYVDYDRVHKMYTIALENIESYDKTVVKKCYRVFQEICLVKSEACLEFVKNNWSGFKDCFSSLESGSPAVKAIKLRGLASIIDLIPKKKSITALLPKIISCVCELSQKAKEAAFDLLQQILQHFLDERFQDDEATLQNFVGMMLSGLGTSASTINATVASVGFIIKAFDEHVTDELLQNVLEKACLLLEADDRSVMRASLDFLIAVMPVLRDDILITHLSTIVQNVLAMPDDVRKPLRPKIQELLTKLIKRFGRGLVVKYVPEKHHRLITNLHKAIERKKRQQLSKALLTKEFKRGSKDSAERKGLAELLEDSDSDDEKDNTKLLTCIREKTDDSIVNFLDPTSAQSIQSFSAKRPGLKNLFPMASDGRLIIADGDVDLETPKDDKLPKEGGEGLLAELPFGENASKRKLTVVEDDDEQIVSTSKAPEIGIHRALGTQKKDTSAHMGVKYRAKKAKGDIKKAGQPDPYAYIPMDRSTLNKRQSSDKYKSLLRAARKGAKKGAKQRGRFGKK